MYIALLGRQPELSIAELERLYTDVDWFSPSTALFAAPTTPDVQSLGGTQKLGRVVLDIPTADWRRISDEIVTRYRKLWASPTGKITLGISAHDYKIPPKEIQKTGLRIKSALKQAGGSLRLVPNVDAALSSATSHHNKLGLSDNKVELIIVNNEHRTLVAESIGAQNITALAARDQGRPRRDAFVGMLPPKLAQLMINLAGPLPVSAPILDPFCGTGVVLQEALLKGYAAYGTDLSEKMVQYSKDNLTWLEKNYTLNGDWKVQLGDAMTTQWETPIAAVVCETYLGQPFSAPPSPKKLEEVRKYCDYIVSTFLRNLSKQIPKGTPVVLAIPAWRAANGTLTHLPLTSSLEELGYSRVSLKTAASDKLAYFREDQVVARELLILTR